MTEKEIYEKSEEFREYVKKYAIKHEISPETALTHQIVKNYAMVIEKEKRYAIS